MAEEIKMFTASFSADEETINAEYSSDEEDISADFGTVMRTGGGVRNYERLTHKPSINEIELNGDKSFTDLGLSELTNIEIAEIVNRVFD